MLRIIAYFRKKYKLTLSEYEEWCAATFDFFGAITKNKIGSGHRNIYYKGALGKNTQRWEMLAHASENFYDGGNPVFKELFPEIYADTLKLWDELLKNK